MEQRRYTVYKHTSPSGKVYIGITCQPVSVRWNNGNGYKGSPLFWNAIQKYGWENIDHEVILEGLDERTAKAKEVELIALHCSNNPAYGYNISKGGDGVTGYKQSPEHIKKRVDKVTPQLRGRHLSDEHKAKIAAKSGYWTGKKRSAETCEKLSKAFTGRKRPPFSDETKAKMRAAAAQRPPEHYEKMAAHFRKAVAQCDKNTGDVIAVYDSARAAQQATGTRYQDISNCIRGRQKTAHGYSWKLVGED